MHIRPITCIHITLNVFVPLIPQLQTGLTRAPHIVQFPRRSHNTHLNLPYHLWLQGDLTRSPNLVITYTKSYSFPSYFTAACYSTAAESLRL